MMMFLNTAKYVFMVIGVVVLLSVIFRIGRFCIDQHYFSLDYGEKFSAFLWLAMTLIYFGLVVTTIIYVLQLL